MDELSYEELLRAFKCACIYLADFSKVDQYLGHGHKSAKDWEIFILENAQYMLFYEN